MATTPIAPAEVRAGMARIRAQAAELHIMHDCDADCPPDCPDRDYSEAAYRHHDEHNADVRETLAELAEHLVDALENWLGPGPGGSERQP